MLKMHKFQLGLDRIGRVLKQNIYVFGVGHSVLGLKILWPVVLGMVGIGFQVMAIALLFTVLKDGDSFARTQTKLHNLGIDFPLSRLFDSNLKVSFFVLIMLSIAAVSSFLYQKLTIRYSSAVESYLIDKLSTLSKNTNLFIVPKIEGISHKNAVLRSILADSRGINRSLQVAITIFIPIITLLLATGFVLYLNWQVSLTLLPIAVLFAIGIFKVNEAGIKGSHFFDNISSTTRKYLSNYLFLSGPSTQLERRSIQKYVDAYYELLIIAHRSSFVNDMAIAVVLTIIFYGMTMDLRNLNKNELANIAAYLIALRYAISYLKQFTNKFSVMNRFYPQTTRLRFFMDYLDSQKISSHEELQKVVLKKFNQTLTPGNIYLINNNYPIDRFSALALINELVSPKEPVKFRNVAVMARENFLTRDERDESEIYKQIFYTEANTPGTQWIVTDRWSLKKQNITTEELLENFKDKFILLCSAPTQEDVDHKRILLEFSEDLLVSVRMATIDNEQNTNRPSANNDMLDDLMADDF